MPPKRDVVIGQVDGVQSGRTCQSSRILWQAPNEVVIGHVKPPASGPQPSGSRRKKGTNTEVIIQAPADPPLQEDVLEAGDDLDDQPQAKVCVFMTQYLICDKQSSDTYGQMAPASW